MWRITVIGVFLYLHFRNIALWLAAILKKLALAYPSILKVKVGGYKNCFSTFIYLRLFEVQIISW